MNSARVFPAIIPESITDILPFILIPVMATGTKCRVFRPGEDAAANQHESVGRKKVKPMLVAARNSGGHSTLLTHDSGLTVRLRVAGPGEARGRLPCFCMLDYFDGYWSKPLCHTIWHLVTALAVHG